MAKEDKFKDALLYICKKGCGYAEDLEKTVEKKYVSEFETVGFITRGHSLKSKTWKKTNFADQYYKDLYGSLSFLKVKLGLK